MMEQDRFVYFYGENTPSDGMYISDCDLEFESLSDFTDFLNTNRYKLSSFLLDKVEKLQRKGFSRCDENDFAIFFYIMDISRIVWIDINPLYIYDLIDINIRELEKNGKYDECARGLNLKKRIEKSEAKWIQKQIDELMSDINN